MAEHRKVTHDGIEDSEAAERRSPSSRTVYEAIALEGEEELERPSAALFWSGLASGLSMGFSMVAEGVLQASLPDTPWRHLVSKIGYSFGFIIIILGRQQLFTENTLTPLLPVLRHGDRTRIVNLLRLWAVVLAANLLGAAAFAVVATRSRIFEPQVLQAFGDIGRLDLEPRFGGILLRGIFAGWLIALIVWLLPYAESFRVVVIAGIAWLVGAAALSHVIAGSVSVFAAAVTGDVTWGHALAGYTLPALIGNTIGGCLLVGALNHRQVVAGAEEP